MADTLPEFFAEMPPIDGRRVLALRGRLGTLEAAELHRLALVLAEDGRDVSFDCAALESLSGSILQILIALRQDLVARGAQVDLVAVGTDLARSLAHAGVSPNLTAG